MEWTEDLSVGVEEIDSQHKELFRRIHNLVEAIKKGECKFVIDGVIKFLEEYAAHHFSEEEGIMVRNGYPEYLRHKTQHSLYLKSLADLKEQAAQPRAQGSSYELSVTTNQVVVDWIVAHIARVDKKLGEFLRERNSGITTDGTA
jgi:hemerythrin